MVSFPDYLHRTGYRLLSEAEWECACRAGTTTARYFGETETLLGEYAWYSTNSGNNWLLPVGKMRPNGIGLFDTLGNVLEWCQDTSFYYKTVRPWINDTEQTGKQVMSGIRVLRGGSFSGQASSVRSAHRSTTQPIDRARTEGFRVGRTLPLPPNAAVRPEVATNLEK